MIHLDNLKKKENIALLSVYHKEGIVDFASELTKLGWGIIASGGTAKFLDEAGIPVCDVSDLVGGGPILEHRVVTLSREVHAGLLAKDSDIKEIESKGIPKIDLVCVDLYPLEEEIDKPNAIEDSVIEKTDIGGPTMLRSAAKGRRIVICDPNDRQKVIDWLNNGRPNKDKTLRELAAKAEEIVANYCLISARYHSKGFYDGIIGTETLTCQYGENAWQEQAAFYSTGSDDSLAVNKFKLITGTSPSYNNICDMNRLLQTITHIAAGFDINHKKVPYIAVACKHGNPCGASIGDSPLAVIKKTIEGDPRAILGGWVITNFDLELKTADALLSYLTKKGERRLLDGIIAPKFHKQAVEMLKRKKDKCRFLTNPALKNLNALSLDKAPLFRPIRGGFLKQQNYNFVMDLNNHNLRKFGKATIKQENDLLLAWAIGSTSNSNTITLVKNEKLIGNGVGQQDRVSCCELAVARAKNAGHKTEGAVAYSDSFFPFDDGPKVLAKSGIKVILASSGSVNDDKVITTCENLGITLYLIPDKIGRGFFGH